MMQIKLLGRPGLTGTDSPVMRGRKAWALLAFLLLEETRASRTHLAELLFAEADDPVRALRWNLTEIRRSLGSDAISQDGYVQVDLPEGTTVDALSIVSGPWWMAMSVVDLDRPLLEGYEPSASPGFEAWLASKRRFLQRSAASSLREAVLAQLAEGQMTTAIASAVRLVKVDPFDAENHALLIRAHKAGGDISAAKDQLAACKRLFMQELGVEPGPQVEDALRQSLLLESVSPLTKAAVRTKIQAGKAAFGAGAVASGLTTLREAAGAATILGEDTLKLDAWLELGSALAHAGRAHHPEGAAILHRCLGAASPSERGRVAPLAALELAWMEFMAARYGRARYWVNEALQEGAEDEAIKARALWIGGKCWTETGHYGKALDDLREATQRTIALGDRGRRSFCQASLGRALMLRGELEEAAVNLREAIAVGQEEGFHWTAPLPQAFLAEVHIRWSGFDEALDLLEHSLAGAMQLGDSSWEAFACRGFGRYHTEQGNIPEGMRWLKRGYSKLVESPDCEWAFAFVLDGLADTASAAGLEESARWVDELEHISTRTGMSEMVCLSYLYRSRLGDELALDKARGLAQTIDNPELHRKVDLVHV